MSKSVVIVFGEMGAGKSYVGKRLADDLGFEFVEGDDLLPGYVKETVERFGAMTDTAIDDICSNIYEHVAMRLRFPIKGVVVSQALYKEKHRKELVDAFKKCGYSVAVTWVRAGFWTNLKRLWSRPKGLRWVLYWLASKPFFEKPKMSHEAYNNG